MNLFSYITCASSEWTGFGLTAGDWVAIITLIGGLLGLLIGAIKLIDDLRHAISDLNDTVRAMNDANKQRDEDYKKMSDHLQRHDRQFVRDEERINEIFRLLKNGGSNHDKQD